MDKFLEIIKNFADQSYQESVWLGKNTEFCDSALEMYESLFDDFGGSEFIKNSYEISDDEKKTLYKIIDMIDSYFDASYVDIENDAAILSDPIWIETRSKVHTAISEWK